MINNTTLQKILICVALICTILMYQNCGDTVKRTFEFSSSNFNSSPSPSLPSPFSSSCITGEKLQIELLNDEIVTDSTDPIDPVDSIDIISYAGPVSAYENYNYYSASAHPIYGPKPVDDRFNIFFYKDEKGLNLNLLANKDESEVRWSKVYVDIEITGNTLEDEVILSDDDLELKKIDQNSYRGRFRYGGNTDGGVIGPIGIDDNFTIVIKFLETETNTEARFFSASGDDFVLEDSDGQISSFKISYKDYVDCN